MNYTLRKALALELRNKYKGRYVRHNNGAVGQVVTAGIGVKGQPLLMLFGWETEIKAPQDVSADEVTLLPTYLDLLAERDQLVADQPPTAKEVLVEGIAKAIFESLHPNDYLGQYGEWDREKWLRVAHSALDMIPPEDNVHDLAVGGQSPTAAGVLAPIEEMLSYAHLHWGQHERWWTSKLTTPHKELLADLIDAGHRRSLAGDGGRAEDDEPIQFDRWWRSPAEDDQSNNRGKG